MKVLYLDESGDHNLTVVDPQFPVFVLGGVIVDQEYADGPLTEALNDFKREMFGRTDVVLHTADIVRRRGGFEMLKEDERRERFYRRLNQIMGDLSYVVVACAIRKNEHVSRYGTTAMNPYMLSLEVLVERFCYDIGNETGAGLIVAERRSPILDRTLELAWENLTAQGTRFLRPRTVAGRIVGLDQRAKQRNIAGLQLADLVVSPIARHLIGKSDMGDWSVVEKKLRRGPNGQVDGYGLVVMPK